jgi:hypothetical protein
MLSEGEKIGAQEKETKYGAHNKTTLIHTSRRGGFQKEHLKRKCHNQVLVPQEENIRKEMTKQKKNCYSIIRMYFVK